MTVVGLMVLTGLLHLAAAALVVGPLAWWTARRRRVPVMAEGGGRTLVAAAGIYVGSLALLSLPHVGLFADLAWNWQNKALLFVGLTILVAAGRTLSWQQVGVTTPTPGWWRPVLVALAGVVAFQAVAGPMGDPALSAETVAFQALVPGFDEELLFRGILLLLLDRASTVQRQMWGSQIGWAVPITILLFGLLHGLRLTDGLALVFDPVTIVATGTAGLLLAWIRTSTDSLWPAILLHNGINSSVVAFAALAR